MTHYNDFHAVESVQETWILLALEACEECVEMELSYSPSLIIRTSIAMPLEAIKLLSETEIETLLAYYMDETVNCYLREYVLEIDGEHWNVTVVPLDSVYCGIKRKNHYVNSLHNAQSKIIDKTLKEDIKNVTEKLHIN